MKVRRQLGDIHAQQRQPLHFALEHRAAHGDVGVVRDAPEPRPHLVLRPRRGEIAVMRRQPVAAGLAQFGGQYLDPVAALRLKRQRHDAAVDLGAAAAMADFRMHEVREIQHRRAVRQVENLSR